MEVPIQEPIPEVKPPKEPINRLMVIYLVIGAVLLLFVLVIFIVFSFNGNNSRSVGPPQPSITKTKLTPTVLPVIKNNPANIEGGGAYSKSVEKINEKNKDLYHRDSAVGALYNKLPFTGTNFSMEYSYATNKFIVTISSSHKSEGNSEFQQFLSSNGIQDKSWLSNLTITYK